MKTFIALLLIVSSLGTAMATEDAASGSEQFCPMDRLNPKANLDDADKEKDQDDAALSV